MRTTDTRFYEPAQNLLGSLAVLCETASDPVLPASAGLVSQVAVACNTVDVS